ncbi:hypothetical protein [uncultured Ottowia sp.]|nr:hypothetical protein [uncultured Ottowia sp.]
MSYKLRKGSKARGREHARTSAAVRAASANEQKHVRMARLYEAMREAKA